MQVTDIGSAKTGQDQSTGPSRQKPIATLYEAILALDLKYDELVREKKRLVDLQAEFDKRLADLPALYDAAHEAAKAIDERLPVEIVASNMVIEFSEKESVATIRDEPKPMEYHTLRRWAQNAKEVFE